MGVPTLIFVLVGVPIAFCLLTYLVATAYRVYFPEKPIAPEGTLEEFRRPLPMVDEPVAVGVREIKEDQRRLRGILSTFSYSYSNGFSNGLPSNWLEEVWRRRN